MTAFRTVTDEERFHDGFQMEFKNGCRISVMFSKYTYSDAGKTTAEVAAFSKNDNWMVYQEGKWIELPEGTTEIMPRQTPEEVAQLIYTLSNL
jgi:hypothetical protein